MFKVYHFTIFCFKFKSSLLAKRVFLFSDGTVPTENLDLIPHVPLALFFTRLRRSIYCQNSIDVSWYTIPNSTLQPCRQKLSLWANCFERGCRSLEIFDYKWNFEFLLKLKRLQAYFMMFPDYIFFSTSIFPAWGQKSNWTRTTLAPAIKYHQIKWSAH